MSRNTVARIDLDALRHNLGVVRDLADGAGIVCVIKADGYGHGIERVARALHAADQFAVATPGEARSVRDAGWNGPLLLLEGFSDRDDFDTARQLDLDLVIHHRSQLELLRDHGITPRQRLWLKLDTGMHRLGFPWSDVGQVLAALESIRGRAKPVLMSHFACADDPSSGMTRDQVQRFDQATTGLELDHSLANSAAILNYPETCRDLVRPGIMLYGISPVPGQTGHDHGLKPVMTLQCEIIAVNECRAGDRVGYGASYTCPHDMQIGVAAIGYGDGYPRHLKDGTPLLVNGQPARLAGRVSMDLVTIDLCGQAGVAVGDPVVLWGAGLPVEQVAEWAGAIPYELVCGVTGRVDRVEAG
ncbi:MAG: alanine racemase [Xanthomonadales bacterium]|nr:alanine racemase [Xanthomonadales bacterium]